MKLRKLRIENFKSIDDSGEFKIDQVTCLLGKNEAGKSAILEALEKLNPIEPNRSLFEETEFPRRRVSTNRERGAQAAATVLTTTWELEDEDEALLVEIFGVFPLSSHMVSVSKGYDNVLFWDLPVDLPALADLHISQSRLNASERSQLGQAEDIETLIATLTKLESPTPKHSELKKRLQETFPGDSPESTIAEHLTESLPKIIYFTEYDKLPGRISIEDLVQRQRQNDLRFGDKIFLALLDLASSSTTDVRQIKASEQLIMELEAISNRLTDEIFEYWTQNQHLDVQFRFDAGLPADAAPFNSGQVFSTRIYNRRHRATVNFDERSTGFIWFFSFLIWFSQIRQTYGNNLLILLDEPGLSLHGTAQRDLLRYFNEKLRPYHQLIYTTHSPFMIDTENIFSVRTVQDVVIQADGRETVLGTKVGERILSRDRDTILPLQGIAGFDIAQTMFVGPYVLVVEGPAEAGYIHWFSRELVRLGRHGLDIRWAVCPAEGASKVSSFVSLFSGRGLKIAALLDYHDGQKRMVDQLEGSGLLPQGHLLKTADYVSQEDSDIEDVVGRPLMRYLYHQSLHIVPPHELPHDRPATPPTRVIKELDEHAGVLPPGYAEFDHYMPVNSLFEIEQSAIADLPGIDEALDRFEDLFEALNNLI